MDQGLGGRRFDDIGLLTSDQTAGRKLSLAARSDTEVVVELVAVADAAVAGRQNPASAPVRAMAATPRLCARVATHPFGDASLPCRTSSAMHHHGGGQAPAQHGAGAARATSGPPIPPSVLVQALGLRAAGDERHGRTGDGARIGVRRTFRTELDWLAPPGVALAVPRQLVVSGQPSIG